MAFAVTIIRGIGYGEPVGSLALAASLSLFAFAAAGYVLGTMADQTVHDSVWQKTSSELSKLRGDEAVSPSNE